MLKLAQTMFDTKLPPGVLMLQPFSEESSIKKIAVQVHFRMQISISPLFPEVTHPCCDTQFTCYLLLNRY